MLPVATLNKTHCRYSVNSLLTIRFVAPIKVGDAIKIVGRLVIQRLGMYQLEAALYVDNKAFVTASAKFIQPKSGVIG